MDKNKKIVFFHLWNDYSGSPKVLRQVIEIALIEGYNVDLYTSKTEGFLSNIDGVTYKNNRYRLSNFKLLTLWNLIYSQGYIFFKLKKYKKEKVLFYINTILPFGAGLASRRYKVKSIYHIHETSVRPQILKSFLLKVIVRSKARTIYVSKYLKEKEVLENESKVVYNVLPPDYLGIVPTPIDNRSYIMMACSLKKYKGVYEFIKLAKKFPGENFLLILNATDEEIKMFFRDTKIPDNIDIRSKQLSLHAFYAKSKLVLNLSNPNEWIETFGLTILEAMAYGIPVIVPNVGGPTEIVEDNFNGYRINSTNLNAIQSKIMDLLSDKKLYSRLSNNAITKAKKFNPDNFELAIIDSITS